MSLFSPHSFLLTLTVAGSLTGAANAARMFPMANATAHNGSVDATTLYKNTNEVLAIPLRRLEHRGVPTTSLARRYFGTDVLGVYGAAYFAEMMIGGNDNPQTVSVLLDTGSFEMWVNPNCSAANVKDYCEAFGHYDPTISPTAKSLNTNFGIQYGQGSASGVYYKDDVYLSGAQIKEQQFGVSNTSSDVWFGILGLGRGQGGGVVNYSSIVDSLADQGYTNSKLFSLDLGGQPGPSAAITGEMVFGGVDTNKYSGNLAKVPTDPKDPHYVVTLNSLSMQTPNAGDNAISRRSEPINDTSLPLQVVVDSGTTLSLLPESMVTALAAGFPGATSDGSGGYKVPCDLRNSTDSSLDFEFAGEGNEKVTITVSYADFIWYGGDECFLGAQYNKDIGVWILGDTFLRGAYVTFDQSNNALYMANYAKCGEESNLVPVPAGVDAAANIPGSCERPVVVRPASPVESGPDCTETLLPPAATTTATLNRQASAAPVAPEDGECDCDEDDNDGGEMEESAQRFAYHSEHFEYHETFTASETFISTMFRHIVYTMSEQEYTHHESFVTTFCPGDILPPPTPSLAHIEVPTQPMPQPTITPTPAQPAVVQVTQPATTILTQKIEITTTERCETSTYTVTACDAVNDGCTVGATTTRVMTLIDTVTVKAHPAASPPPPPSPISIESIESTSSSPTSSPHTTFAHPSASISPTPTPSPAPTVTHAPQSISVAPDTPTTFFSYSNPLPPPPPSPPSQGVAYGNASWAFNNGSVGASAPVIAAAPSRGFGAGVGMNVNANAPTPTKSMSTATATGFVVPMSGAAGRMRGGERVLVDVGLLAAMVVAWVVLV
ncbi:acid protease [Annulohypoxylon maeteangense]|uniref:acid protease n=1 Tax=Annulohypoxylon maeteangense TaxID=1927788 RepID=UPI0020086421|nr:acid protease [Annulohypoxylon maeteangense]KAI0880512.1 acid protease [Annulohypoxylon maeteangense]